MWKYFGQTTGTLAVLAAVVAVVAVALWSTPPDPRPAVLVESSAWGGKYPRRGDVSLTDADDERPVTTAPVGTRCVLLGPATTSSVLIECGGRRFWADRSCVRPLRERGDGGHGGIPAGE